MRGLLVTVCLSVGAAAAVLAWLPAGWPNPLAQGALDVERAVPQLRAAAAAVDAACVRGDLLAFGEVTTAEHRDELVRRLRAVDRPLDGEALRELGDVAGQA
ncbi:MAG: hypothetical protein ABIP94_04330, partial [Planctomycetota bacterium]